MNYCLVMTSSCLGIYLKVEKQKVNIVEVKLGKGKVKENFLAKSKEKYFC